LPPVATPCEELRPDRLKRAKAPIQRKMMRRTMLPWLLSVSFINGLIIAFRIVIAGLLLSAGRSDRCPSYD
jgi:hypothetical protein